ncbi:hypothetical protein BO94DRAFT_539671 [Aspergillus sclerotioniger CBS 115572]|uniref:Uncharacterized protein n=1 Tax=Aspergillus sclerotioniger CBS 115572 TaxID=1450535 RepID=A0A317VDP0_9EURO|nr:hypothetical protein BO94DRAFT_539671 [Aspergillus sclerotioniger CBS 115572]PWY71128.1 hypothetical protein BO94DRAFT_539671 [Aspergillus sclerotioniger CBS 115572]
MRLAALLYVLVHLLALTSAAMAGFMGSAYIQAAERLQQLTAHLAPDSVRLNLSQLTNRTARLVDAHKPQIVRLASQAGNATKDYVGKHPVQCAFSVVTFFYPVGILRVVGYGPLGPHARSIAAWTQTYGGNPAAGSLRAYLQSAAMNGYGVSTVYNTIRGLVLSAGGYQAWREASGEGEKIDREKNDKD